MPARAVGVPVLSGVRALDIVVNGVSLSFIKIRFIEAAAHPSIFCISLSLPTPPPSRIIKSGQSSGRS